LHSAGMAELVDARDSKLIASTKSAIFYSHFQPSKRSV